MRKFLVIGVYDDDGTRFADEFEAETPDAAEACAPAGLIVAGVVELVTDSEGKPRMHVVG